MINKYSQLSVIVISKDDPDGLIRTIRSVEAQSLPPLEIIVVAAGLSQLAKSNVIKNEIASFYHDSGNGISSAFNFALRATSGLWVNFLNGGDSYSNNDVLNRFLFISRASPHAAIITGIAVDTKSSIKIPREKDFRRKNVPLISHQASFFKKDLFIKFGGYSEFLRCRMDYEWMLRLPTSIHVEWTKEVLVNFEGGGISSTHPFLSSKEEFIAMRIHHLNWQQFTKLILLKFPFRLLRHVVKKFA